MTKAIPAFWSSFVPECCALFLAWPRTKRNRLSSPCPRQVLVGRRRNLSRYPPQPQRHGDSHLGKRHGQRQTISFYAGMAFPQLLRRPPFCRTSGPSSAYFLTSFPLNSLEKSTCHTQFLSCTREARAGPNGSISMAYSLRPNAEPPLTGRLPERCFSGTVPPFP